MAIHSSILAWRISWTEELGGLQSPMLQSTTEVTEHALFKKKKKNTPPATSFQSLRGTDLAVSIAFICFSIY